MTNLCTRTHTHPNPVARNMPGRGNSGSFRRKKVCKSRVNSFSPSLPLFLAKIQSSPSRTLRPGFHGQGRVEVTTHWSPQCGSHSRDAGFALSPFQPPPGSGPGLLPRPSQREGPFRFLEENNAGLLGGCLWSCFLREGDYPGSSCLPLQPPARNGLNSRAFLRKCLSWQQLQPSPPDSSSTALPSSAGGERGGAKAGREVGLGERPD